MTLVWCNDLKGSFVNVVKSSMKKVGGLLLAALMLAGCKKSADCTSAQYKYNFAENRKIDIVRLGGYLLWPQVNSGNNIVFSYSMLGESCIGRSDGPSGEYLVFEIPSNATNFNYSSIDLQTTQCYYGYDEGVGSSNDAIKIVQGTIKGNKISINVWAIEANIVIPGRTDPLSFKRQFNPQ